MIPIALYPFIAKALTKNVKEPALKQPPPRKKDEPKPWLHDINYQQFKRGIVQPENSGRFNYEAKNPLSSATGAYQILYKQHEDQLRSEYAYEPSQTCVIEGCEISAIHQHYYP